MLGYGIRTVVIVAALLLLPADTFAQTDQVITFPSTVPATIRQTSGVVARGNLVKITPTLVVIRTTKGKELELEMTTIRTLRTLDGELQFIPSQDSYDDLLKRASRVGFATVEAEASEDGDGSGGRSGPQPNRPPAFAMRGSLPPRPAGDENDDAGGFANPGGFGGIDDGGFGPPRDLQPMAGRAEPRMPVVETTEPETSGEYGEEPPRRTGFEAVMRDTPDGNGNAAAGQAGGARAPAQPPAGSQSPAAGQQGFSVTTMPMWAKVGFFGAMIGVFYVVVLRKW
ncbi:hypothetical protein Mal4_21430 [Maioricimonas rarisocia]|uniref:Uncharacterized protein n=1 Tax=Maioricimonas rarisocia TaxID=2528026 RepID=A0A517Z5R7_9PLAN|nr:hypothetical protein [Maioricimonas rarisocia]QDU37826.1 hypothetical protein Mal4_21430 [Maioricimonas rarisocia]